MTDSLLAIVGLGVLAGGAIVLIDSLILRRIRNQDPNRAPVSPPVPEPTTIEADDEGPNA